VKRAYEPASAADGGRVLVDRVWPRGITKSRLRIDAWLADLGPSAELRKWFAHDPARWEGFRRRFRRELAKKSSLLHELLGYTRRGRLTLVYGARDTAHNQAVVIKELLEGAKLADVIGAGGGREGRARRSGEAFRRILRPRRRKSP
jgi:uncharacterized protein YeaO (DUF488 family)